MKAVSDTRVRRTQEERDELVEQYLPLVRHVVARLPVTMPNSLDRDDFFSVGVMGLIHAATNYDPNRGASFKTFAYTAIRGAILDEIRKHDPVPRNRRDRLRKMERMSASLRVDLGRAPTIEELAEALEVRPEELDSDLLALHTCRVLSLDESHESDEHGPQSLVSGLVSDEAPDPGDALATADDVAQLARAIGELPDAERNVVVLYHYEDLYLKEIGSILGVTESRVSQILSRATERLRLKMQSPGSEE
ncbi:MAG: FliA/WhiG family RNA polymerase sigma factor [Planctomycetes bacterium]|nr:FliA/WhiG family RNA polymerase sigma factor [Planctomycetota bacterium]